MPYHSREVAYSLFDFHSNPGTWAELMWVKVSKMLVQLDFEPFAMRLLGKTNFSFTLLCSVNGGLWIQLTEDGLPGEKASFLLIFYMYRSLQKKRNSKK